MKSEDMARTMNNRKCSSEICYSSERGGGRGGRTGFVLALGMGEERCMGRGSLEGEIGAEDTSGEAHCGR